MLSGRPVVATSVGGVPEALGDARLLGRPGDPADLARALSDVLRLSESERREVGQALRRRAEVMFSRDRFLRRYRDVYIELGQSA
jgi:glycosyltransferase involved in cell wall biosynthesis